MSDAIVFVTLNPRAESVPVEGDTDAAKLDMGARRLTESINDPARQRHSSGAYSYRRKLARVPCAAQYIRDELV